MKRMTYEEKKIADATKYYGKIMEKSNLYVPTDAWLSPARAEKANKAWQDMMSSIQTILRITAMEKMKWPAEKGDIAE